MNPFAAVKPLRRAARERLSPPPAPLAAFGLNPLRGVLEGLLDPSAFGEEGVMPTPRGGLPAPPIGRLVA